MQDDTQDTTPPGDETIETAAAETAPETTSEAEDQVAGGEAEGDD